MSTTAVQTRRELEMSKGWVMNNPALAVQSITKFIKEGEELGMVVVKNEVVGKTFNEGSVTIVMELPKPAPFLIVNGAGEVVGEEFDFGNAAELQMILEEMTGEELKLIDNTK